MNVSRRRILIGGAVLVGEGALAACGGQPGAPPAKSKVQGTVVLMRQGQTPDDQQRYQPLVDQFHAKGGPVKIDMIEGDPGGGAVNAQAKLITLVAAGTPPDVFWTHAYIMPNIIKLNLLADAMPYAKQDREFKLDNYFEAPLKDYLRDGKLYGLPREATTTIMILNKELFTKNGVPLPNENWTWDDYVKSATALTKGDGPSKTWGAAGWGGQGGSIVYPIIRAWQEGGDMVDSARAKFTLHQSPAVDAIQQVVDLVTKQRVHPWGSDFPGNNIAESWNSGRLGTVVQISVYNSFNKAQFDWDIHHLPRGKSRSTRTASAGHSITAASKVKEAAWEVLKYFGSKAAYEHWARLGLTLPTYREVAQGPLVINPNAPPRSAKIALDAFSYARPEPIGGDWGNVQAEVGKAFTRAFSGEVDARTALTAIVQVVESLLARVPTLSQQR